MEITPEIIAGWKVKKEVILRKRYDFTVMSVEQMQAIEPPGDLQMRSIWQGILQDKITRQAEIDDLSFSKDFFVKFDKLPDTDKVKMFAETDNGGMRLKTRSELAEDRIFLSAEVSL